MNSTINISLPTSMLNDAKSVTRFEGFTSISELIRHALRQILYPNGLTVNGFTPEFEDLVLESAKEPISNGMVFETEKDIHDYFINLKLPTKIKRNNAKNSN
jgi:hypothetical protein